MPLFELTLTRSLTILSLQIKFLSHELKPIALKGEFLEHLESLRFRAGGDLHNAEQAPVPVKRRKLVNKNCQRMRT
jgi:hypothetical protein